MITAFVALCACAAVVIYLLILINELRGYRLGNLDRWTREFYKAMDDALACKDVSPAADVIEVMNDSVANSHSAATWILVFSRAKTLSHEAKKPSPDFLNASPELKEAVTRCVIAGIFAVSYRSLVTGFILRGLMADFFAEPPRAVEFAGRPDLRSKVRHPAHAAA